jgi:multidrug resistance efflux pump
VVASEVGIVGTELVSEGDTVTAGETMARVFDHRRRYILWELPDDMLRLPYLGEAVTIETANMTIEGQVDRFAQQSGENRTTNTNRGRLVYVSVDQADAKRLALKTSVIVRMGYF